MQGPGQVQGYEFGRKVAYEQLNKYREKEVLLPSVRFFIGIVKRILVERS